MSPAKRKMQDLGRFYTDPRMGVDDEQTISRIKFGNNSVGCSNQRYTNDRIRRTKDKKKKKKKKKDNVQKDIPSYES